MKLTRLDLRAGFDWARRDKKYLLLLVLTFVLLLTAFDFSAPAPDLSSPEVDKLEAASEAMKLPTDDASAWIDLFEKHPVALLFWILFTIVFAGLFMGGWLWICFTLLIRRLRSWVSESVQPSENAFGFEMLFRALVLIFAGIVLSGAIIALFFNPEAVNHQAVLHTLAIDALACLCVFSVMRERGFSWRSFFSPPAGGYWNEIKQGLAAYIAVFPLFLTVMIAVFSIADWLNYEPPAHALVKIFVEEQSRSPFVFYAAIGLATVAAPFMEEIFFRGFCYPVFKREWGVKIATVASAGFFAVMHGSGIALAPIFVLGFALTRLFERRGHLAACWTFHVIHNILFTGYFFASKALLGF